MKYLLYIALCLLPGIHLFASPALPVANGREPSVVKNRDGSVYLSWGRADSIFFSVSTDMGLNFSNPELVGRLPTLALGAGRGPQLAATADGPVVICTNKAGDIFCFKRNSIHLWGRTQINDVPAVAEEGFLSVSGDGNKKLFAVWLDLRGDHHNKIYGAASENGGKSWQANKLIYRSPDSSVCECCKPTVLQHGNSLYVMFRNWLKGSRDIYLISSVDGGKTFGIARRLGMDTWQLNGCPMDGGGLTVNENGLIITTWRRKNTIYTCIPGQKEQVLDQGKQVGISGVGNNNYVTYVKEGEIICQGPSGKKEKLGKGMLPRITAMDTHAALVVWENDRKIYSALVKG